MTLTAMRPVLGLSKGREVSLWMCGTDVFSHMKATYRGSTTSPTAQASHGDTKTRRKVLGRNADALVGISTPEQDKYGNSETRLNNASIRGTDPSEDQRFSIFELCLEFGKTMHPLESREIIPILFVEIFAFGFCCKGCRLKTRCR